MREGRGDARLRPPIPDPAALGLALYWIVLCAFFLYLCWGVYGGALAPLDGLVVVLPPVCAFLCLFFSPDVPPKEPGRMARLLWTLAFAAAALLLVWVFRSRYAVGSYQILFFLLLFAALARRHRQKKKHLSRFFLVLFTVYLLAILGFCAMVRPVTVRQGAALVQQQGYTQVHYRGPVRSPAQVGYIFSGRTPDGKMGCYLYSAQTGGTPCAVLVSVQTGALLGRAFGKPAL